MPSPCAAFASAPCSSSESSWSLSPRIAASATSALGPARAILPTQAASTAITAVPLRRARLFVVTDIPLLPTSALRHDRRLIQLERCALDDSEHECRELVAVGRRV